MGEGKEREEGEGRGRGGEGQCCSHLQSKESAVEVPEHLSLTGRPEGHT